MAGKYWNKKNLNDSIVEYEAAELEKSDIDPKIAAKLFRILFNNSPSGIYTIQNGRFKLANPQFQRMTGYNLAELQGLTSPLRLVHPKDRVRVRENAKEMLEGSDHDPYQYRYVKKDGGAGWVMETVTHVQDSSKKLILGNVIDITNLKMVEKEATDSQEYYRILFEHSRDAVFAVTPEARCIKVNPAACRMLGYKQDELMRMSVFDLMPPESAETPLFDSLLRQGHVFGEITLKKKDGGSIFAEINATELPDGNYIGTVRDITGRKQVEEELRERGAKYRQLVEYAPAGIYEIDFINLKFTSVNDVMCEYTGFTREEFLSLNPFEILSDESKQSFSQRLLKSFAGEPVPEITEFKIKGKNGREFWVIINARYIYKKGVPVGATVVAHNITERKRVEEALRLSEERFFKAFNLNPIPMIITSLNKGQIIEANKSFLKNTGYRASQIVSKDPNRVKFWHSLRDLVKIKKIILEKGAIYNYELTYHTRHNEHRTGLYTAELIELNGEECLLSTINDITERKLMEQEMARLERLNLIGEMAAGIGHEVRNPMTSVRGFLQMLSSKEDCSKYRDFFKIMIEELDRANSIITEYLSLAKNNPLDLRLQNLNSIILSMEPLIAADSMNSQLNYSIELGDIGDLPLDEKQIRQLILNLLRNGMDAMDAGGTITIKTFKARNETVLMVQDQGKGISPDITDKIGNPFFTTKESGTGLGLAVCYSIASRHRASIKFDTGPTGTAFYLRFKSAE